MAEILIDIECEEETCGACQAFDNQRNHCGAFNDFTDGDTRLSECINAEDVARDLLEEEDEDGEEETE